MAKYIEYERLKILFRKFMQPFPKTSLNRKGFHCIEINNKYD